MFDIFGFFCLNQNNADPMLICSAANSSVSFILSSGVFQIMNNLYSLWEVFSVAEQRPASVAGPLLHQYWRCFLQNTQNANISRELWVSASGVLLTGQKWTPVVEKHSQALAQKTLLRIEFPFGNKMNLEYAHFLFFFLPALVSWVLVMRRAPADKNYFPF